ncbi:hypothetical protein CAC42_2461 [Sphaceloma murrayae]|uniref:Nucleoside phosphorylase domain-containing protein n=1 Tax=Sphaceloma murrayae TaxID=2082308 RepID=A0A2K1QW50_9PEZI|nr:hypothetical protein CAC42_2461 [Sphaceloma murrayae]
MVANARCRVGIICALPLEADAVILSFDHVYADARDYRRCAGDTNSYTFGRLGDVDVVLAHLPEMGGISAAIVGANLNSSFPELELVVVAGICGGIPYPVDGQMQIHLGDLAISTGVIQYDFGRRYPTGFRRKNGLHDSYGRPQRHLRSFIKMLETAAHRASVESLISTYMDGLGTELRPPQEHDILYKADHLHKHRLGEREPCGCLVSAAAICEEALRSSCADLGCNTSTGIQRKRSELSRQIQKPRVHFGIIGSASVVMKSGRERDEVARDGPLIALEMEGAGVWDMFSSCLVVKSVCDYADSHKHKGWQSYAASVAAAGTKAILQKWVVNAPSTIPNSAAEPSAQASRELGVASEHWLIPRQVNRLFTGRDSALKRIEDTLRSHMATPQPQEACCIVITGMGGQGKSEICLRIAHRMRSDDEQAKAGFLAIADITGKSATSIDQVKHILENQAQPWLLILDNADDTTRDYGEYLPSGARSRTIITTRNLECGELASEDAHLRLDGLEDTEAEELMFKAAKIPSKHRSRDHDAIVDICRILGNHALAIIQAGAYIAKGLCSLERYSKLFETQQSRLLRHHPVQAKSRYGNVYSTFEVAAEVLKASSTVEASDAMDLLTNLAMLSWTDLPLTVFATAREMAFKLRSRTAGKGQDEIDRPEILPVEHTERLIDLLDLPSSDSKLAKERQATSAPWDDYRLQAAVATLESLALLTKSDTGDYQTVRMHPLVHAWAKDRIPLESRGDIWLSTGCLIVLSAEHTYWKTEIRLLQPHVLQLTDSRIIDEASEHTCDEVIRLFGHLINVLDRLRLDRQCLDLLEALFDRLHLSATNPDVSRWPLYRLYGLTLRRNGLYRFSVDVFSALVGKLKSMAIPKPDRLRSAMGLELARSLSLDSQHAEALRLLNSLLELKRSTSASDDSEILTIEHELGSACRRAHQPSLAIQLFKHVLSVHTKTLLETDVEVVGARFELAAAYMAAHQHAAAISQLEKVVAVQTTTLRENHPHRLSSQYRLAHAYLEESRFNDAIGLLTRILESDDNLKEEQDPVRLRIQSELAEAYAAAGHVSDAINLFEKVARLSAARLSVSLAMEIQLAKLYNEQGEAEKAISVLEPRMAETSRFSSDLTEMQTHARHVLAYAYMAAAQPSEALQITRDVLPRLQRDGTFTSEEVASWKHLHAIALQASGEPEQVGTSLAPLLTDPTFRAEGEESPTKTSPTTIWHLENLVTQIHRGSGDRLEPGARRAEDDYHFGSPAESVDLDDLPVHPRWAVHNTKQDG